MRFGKIHLCGVHPGPLKMYLFLLMHLHSSADAEWRGWRESGSFSLLLPPLRGGSGFAKDRSLWSVQETEYGIQRSLEPWGQAAQLLTGLLTGLRGPLSLQPPPCSWGPLHGSLRQPQNKGGRRKPPAITVGRGSPGSEFREILPLLAVGT